MLSCSCNDWDGEGWYYTWTLKEDDFDVLKGKRRKRCCSCKSLIDIGANCIEFSRYREALSDIEERIVGQEVELASHYMCEKCSEIFLNLDAIGYCIDINSDMQIALEEYWELTGFKKVA